MVSTHLLEFVEKPLSSIEEIWRILKPNGYFIALVPRRSGLWTRYDNNPFGHGRSYSTTQFKRLIEDYLILDQKNLFSIFPLGIIMLIINSIELLKRQVIVFFPIWVV
ncbi:MAG: hypothetical protein CM15mP70_03660 [Pelagibacteraceae bacterium]|nr:MAG: hypothetical protein CM15mP70_03660 [Pelagibacteraceae bacterium]